MVVVEHVLFSLFNCRYVTSLCAPIAILKLYTSRVVIGTAGVSISSSANSCPTSTNLSFNQNKTPNISLIVARYST